jgi:hypothetical protein
LGVVGLSERTHYFPDNSFLMRSNYEEVHQNGGNVPINNGNMPPMSEEDLEWFKSTFRPIPRPQLPEDAIEYSIYLLSSDPAPASTDTVVRTRARLQEVQKSASELVKDLLKDYIWQREAFSLEIAKENGECGQYTVFVGRANYLYHIPHQISPTSVVELISATLLKMNGLSFISCGS